MAYRRNTQFRQTVMLQVYALPPDLDEISLLQQKADLKRAGSDE
tara:strand:- start:228 stop:359 length:132 start_codon:yes stop_codon:yes gene_type:complete